MLALFNVESKGNVVRFYFTDSRQVDDAKKALSVCGHQYHDVIIDDYTSMTVDAHFSFDMKVDDTYDVVLLVVSNGETAGHGLDRHSIAASYSYGDTVSEVMMKLKTSTGVVDNFEIMEG